jgi:hypothetical protein
VFHRFEKAKLAYGVLTLGSSQFTPLSTAPATFENNAQFKSGQNQPQIKQLALLI